MYRVRILQGTTDSLHTSQFNRFWKITREEIIEHILHYSDAGYTMPEVIASWPAHGDIANNYAENLAPFVDVNENGIYDPELGDYPDVKGDMSLYWILNDNYGEHAESNGIPIGMEIHIQAYAYSNDTLTGIDTVLNYTTFLNYRIINRSDTVYHDFITAFWSDSDIGYAYDDYIGCNVGLNTMFFYNGDDMDGDGNGISYGENPPVQFIALIDAPLAEENDGLDNDNDGTIDEADEKALLNGMMYFDNNSSVYGDPFSAEDYDNYMHCRWKNGESLKFGINGHDTIVGIPSKFMFPGESDPWFNGTNGIDPNYTVAGGWTEENEGNIPADRRGVMNSGRAMLNPGDELDYTLTFVWSRVIAGKSHSHLLQNFEHLARVTEMYNKGELEAMENINLSVKEVSNESKLQIFPNPAQNQIIIKGADFNLNYQIIDIKGQVVKAGEYSKESINIKELSKGTYIVKLIYKNQVSTEKLIIE